MTDWAVSVLLLLGSSFVLLAAVGLLRLPDLYTRMHASTKPATLGVSLLVSGLAWHAGDLGVGARAVLVVVFFLLTAPVAAHRLGRAAYRAGVPRWRGTVLDELAGERRSPRS
jgi:multicomponent Na+:H+ antiporter subunit G